MQDEGRMTLEDGRGKASQAVPRQTQQTEEQIWVPFVIVEIRQSRTLLLSNSRGLPVREIQQSVVLILKDAIIALPSIFLLATQSHMQRSFKAIVPVDNDFGVVQIQSEALSE